MLSRSSESNSMRPLIIVGAGGHAVSVANVALSAGYKLKGFVDPSKAGKTLLDVMVFRDILEAGDPYSFTWAIAIGDNFTRERVWRELKEKCPDLNFPVLCHHSSVISVFTDIGEGTVLMPQSVVGPNSTVGKFCLLNTRASIDHDCNMHDFSSLAPAAVTGGSVVIGKRSAVSIAAVVKHGLKIGDDTILGANSYLNFDLPSQVVAYGSPAKLIRGRSSDDLYLK